MNKRIFFSLLVLVFAFSSFGLASSWETVEGFDLAEVNGDPGCTIDSAIEEGLKVVTLDREGNWGACYYDIAILYWTMDLFVEDIAVYYNTTEGFKFYQTYTSEDYKATKTCEGNYTFDGRIKATAYSTGDYYSRATINYHSQQCGETWTPYPDINNCGDLLDFKLRFV